MAPMRYTAEQIVGKLREVELVLGLWWVIGTGLQADWGDGADLLSLEAGVRGPDSGTGKAAEGARERK